MRSRPLALGFALFVLLAPVAAVGPAAADARLTMTATTVTPATPTAGAPITAQTTLRLSGGSDTAMTVDEVRVVDAETDETYGAASDLGTLSPGETLDVPVTFSVNESGTRDLRLEARGTATDGADVGADRPLTVGVEPGSPQVELDTDEYVAGAPTPVEVTVANPTTAALRDIEVSVNDPAQSGTASIASLAAGASDTVNLSVVAEASGDRTLELTTTYTTPNGAQLDATTERAVTVEPMRTDVGLRTQPATTDDTGQQAGQVAGLLGGGSGALQPQSGGEAGADGERLDVTVTNFGNAAVEEVVLTGEDADGTRLSSVGRFAVTETLQPGASETVTVDLSSVRTSDDIRFVAAYETPEGTAESELNHAYNAQLGEATLTGVDVAVEDGRVTLDGNLANTGDGEVTGAVVAVQPAAGVEPAYPQRTYFVGTVDGSSFAPFELTADVADNATEIPIRLSYAVEGEPVTETVTVPLSPETDGGGGGPPLGIGIALVLALLAVVGGALYVRDYRNQ
jgi:hypothetical protein